jgi:hypothetical protein
MKRLLLLVIVLLSISSVAVFATQPREGLSIGATTGSPFIIGVTGEYNMGTINATATMGYSSNMFLLRIGADYSLTPSVQWEPYTMYPSVGAHLDLFMGGNFSLIGIGIPATLSYYMGDIPLKLSLRIGPEFLIGTTSFFDIFASLSALYFL